MSADLSLKGAAEQSGCNPLLIGDFMNCNFPNREKAWQFHSSTKKHVKRQNNNTMKDYKQ